ncbi:hypothetical protein SDC9_100693 [bioreactor metagenome]|uniref:Uncharacterized protein n=1 Tax=bioreactor metagenome TaxID=1076179 RepID=A0A645ASS7_9ZZZZ|nr:hypothetical protein [Oscillospiraceae bacterium]
MNKKIITAAFALTIALMLTVTTFAIGNTINIIPEDYEIDKSVLSSESYKNSLNASDPDLTVVMANGKEIWYRSKKVEEALVPGTWYYADGMYTDIPVMDENNFPSYYNTEYFAKFNTEINGYKVRFIKNDVTESFIIYLENLETGEMTAFFKPFMMLWGVRDLKFLDTGEILLVTNSARGWLDITVYDPAEGKLICDTTGMRVSDYCINSEGEFYFVAESIVYDKSCNPSAVFAATGTAYDLSVENGMALAKIRNMTEDDSPDSEVKTALAAKK